MKRIATFLTLIICSIILSPSVFAQTTISTGKYTTGATLDADANIYALQYDATNDEYDVVKYDAPGYSTSTVLFNGVSFNTYPTDIEIDSNGDVYFLDGFDDADTVKGRIIVLDASNSYSSTVIDSGDYYTSLGIDSNDDIFVAQYDGSSTYEVVKYDVSNVSNGYSTSVIYNGLGTDIPTTYPRGLTIDSDDHIYVLTDQSVSNGTIYKLTSPGYNSPTVIDSGEYYTGLAVDEHGDLFAMAYDSGDGDYDVVKYTAGAGTPTVFHNGLAYPPGNSPYGLGSNRALGDLVVPDPWDSNNGTLYYYDRTPPPAPMANIPGGSYSTDQTVTLSGESSASIYYTTDGSTPTTASMAYTGAITISSTTTLQAIAVDGAGNESDVLTETYTISTINPGAGNILYVDTNVSGGDGSGDSWANAIPELAEALQWAHNDWDGSSPPLQIWVAEGVYYPTDNPSDRNATFQLKNGVEIYGGFDPDGGIVDLNDERILPSTGGAGGGSILSGDIDGDDSATIITDPGTEIQGNNSYTVVNGSNTDNTALLNGITITGGKADGATTGNSAAGSGGGIYINDGSPALAHLAASGNQANVYGGGVFIYGTSSPELTYTGISYNHSSGSGGGMNNGGDPTIINVTFSGNSAGSYGGGMDNGGDPTITNVTFSGNSATDGGGMINSGAPTLTNVTFSGNSASNGGGVYNDSGSTPTITNSIFWGNSASIGNEMYNLSDPYGDVTVTLSHTLYANGAGDIDNNDFSGGTITVNETASLHEDPQFSDPGNGDYSLQNTSSAINSGNNADYEAADGNSSNNSLSTDSDLASQPRVFDGTPATDIIDIGAYELQSDPIGTITPDANKILYVDTNVSGGDGSGSSWSNALPELSEALQWAHNDWDGSGAPLQIWVAEGVYHPVQPADPNNVTTAEREVSFELLNNVEIYGGFAGGESSRSQRDPAAKVVILSGDLSGDDADGDGDGFPETNRGDNSYHVFYLDGIASAITNATVLDGVTISGGQADAPDSNFPDNSGGGLICIGQGSTCSPTLANNTFRYNSASKLGGGIYNFGTDSGESSPVITDVRFIQNRAASGAGIYNDGGGGASNPVLTDVSFRDNRSLFDGADGNGAAIYNNGSGGQSSPVITNATFTSNHAERDGGAIFNDGRSDGTSDPQIVNAVFVGNSADSNGGGVYSIGGGSNGNSSPAIINATFTENSASADGGGLVNDVTNGGTVGTSLQNTILYGNSAGNGGQQIYNRGSGAHPVIGYTLVEAGTSGITNSSSSSTTYTDDSGSSVNFENSTNIAADPLFADSSDPDGTDNQLGTADDGLQLTPESGAVNAGDPNTDLALFPNGPASPLDLTGAPRVYSGTIERIDMGGYELQAAQDINEAPSFTSSPVTAAEENASYSYQITTQDPDGDGLTITSMQIPDWATLTDNGDGTATLEGTPAFDDSQDYTVELEVSDGELSATQSFTITVDNTNRAPSFDSSPVTSAKEGDAYSYAIEASDPDGDGLSFSAVQIPDWASLTDNGDGTASLEGTPGPDDMGEDQVELKVSDGTATASQSFTITVDNTNRPPVFDSSPVTAAKEGEAYSYTVEASDPDGDGLSFSTVQIPDWASLQDNGDGTATLSGTPGPDDMGDAPVELQVSDGTDTASQSFTITVDNTNRPPVFDSAPVTKVQEQKPYSYTITASDPDGDGLAITAPMIPAWATFADNGDGTAALKGTPDLGDRGDYPVELAVTDGSQSEAQTFTIFVADTNRAPGFDSSPVTAAKEGEAYSYAIAASDPDGDGLTITSVQIPDWVSLTDNGDGTATLKGTPGFDAEGTHSVELTVSDGAADTTQAFEITITGSNRAPDFTSEAVTSARENELYTYTVTAGDPDGDAMEFSGVTIPDWATLTAISDTSATLEGTPGPEDSGDYAVELAVSDGELSATQSFTITVANTNRPPEVTSEPVTEAKEGEAYSYTIEASDPDGEELTITSVQMPDWASFTDNGDGTANLEGMPGLNDGGSYDVELEVSDGIDTAGQSFSITVASTNQKPEILSQPSLQVPSEMVYRYVVAAIDTAGSDTGGKLTFEAELESGAPLPDWLSWEEVPDDGPLRRKALVGTPPASAIGTYEIVVSVADGEIPPLLAEQRFTLRVTQGNQQPAILSSPVQQARMNSAYSYTVEASDPDADNVTFSANLSDEKELPEWLSLQKSSDTTAVLTGKPKEEDIGTYDIKIRATDSGTPQKETSQAFTLEVKYKEVEELKALYNYPNPFNNATKIKFELPEKGEVYMQLYNLTGGLVRETAPQVFDPGANEFEVRARNLASGIYIYRIISEHAAVTGRLTLIR